MCGSIRPLKLNYIRMKKTVIGIGLGTIAGIIDLILMLIQKLPVNAYLSAFTMWIVIGFFVSIIDLKINHILEGIIISLLVFLPNSFIIGWDDPSSLVPIIIITIIIGGLIGYFVNRYSVNT
jgi:hypothetical protein